MLRCLPFYCYAELRGLHSFPTRRSSDLRSAVFASDSFRHAAGRFGRLVWAIGKNAIRGMRGSVPDMLAHAEHRSEEHTSELQSHSDLVCRLLLEKKKANTEARDAPPPAR